MFKSMFMSPTDGMFHWREFLEMTKPKVVAMLLVTALVGMCLASPTLIPVHIVILGLTGIGLMSGAAAAVNHLLDRRLDIQMARTKDRPLPQGKVSPKQALIFAMTLAVAGFVLLYGWINALTAWLTLASLVGYAIVYTAYLKHASPQNIVIGGLAGAMPPLLGWTAVTGELQGHGLLLVIIIFTWTPAHFWALAIHRKDDYARAGLPMLPITHGEEYTKTHIFLYAALLVIACFLPVIMKMSGPIYLLGSTPLTLWFLFRAWQLKFNPQAYQPMQLFVLSIWQLLGIFTLLLLDHYLW